MKANIRFDTRELPLNAMTWKMLEIYDVAMSEVLNPLKVLGRRKCRILCCLGILVSSRSSFS